MSAAGAEGVAIHEFALLAQHSAQLVAGHTSRWLTAISRETQLMVVGARGRGGFNGLVLGSVGQSLLRLSASPVAVVSTYEPPNASRQPVSSLAAYPPG